MVVVSHEIVAAEVDTKQLKTAGQAVSMSLALELGSARPKAWMLNAKMTQVRAERASTVEEVKIHTCQLLEQQPVPERTPGMGTANSTCSRPILSVQQKYQVHPPRH